MSNPHTIKSQQASSKPPRRSGQRLVVWTALVCLSGGLLIAAGVLFVTRQPNQRAGGETFAPEASSRPATATAQARRSEADVLRAVQPMLVDDDRQTLWVSPTDGPPLKLAYLPPGGQIIVSLRLAALAEHPEGDKVFDALGPLGVRGFELLNDMLLQPADVEQVIVGCQVASDGFWDTTLVVRLSGGIPAAEHVAKRSPNAVRKNHNGEDYWLAGSWAYYTPKNDAALMVVASARSITEVIELAGEPPPLRRDMERLLAHTDAMRDATVIVAPNALFSEGGSIFEGELAGLRDPLFWFFGDELSAAALSLHWEDDFYLELIATPTLDTSPERAARILSERLEHVPDELEQHVERLDPQPYGRAIVNRFPAMVRQLVAHTRSGYEPDRAVLRCYLPAVAGHNLILGSELTLAEQLGASGTVAEATAPSSASSMNSESARQRLERVTSLRFARDTLAAALEQLAQDIGIEIVIRGPDLQAEGITKNQSFGINLHSKPAEAILVEILRLANPDKTATEAADPRQKLVYVILSEGGAEQIAVTTRAAAAERGDELPPAFIEKRP